MKKRTLVTAGIGSIGLVFAGVFCHLVVGTQVQAAMSQLPDGTYRLCATPPWQAETDSDWCMSFQKNEGTESEDYAQAQ